MNCCNRPVILRPSAAWRARHYGGTPQDYTALFPTHADALALKPGLKSPAKAETTAPKEPVPSPTQAGRGEATPFGLPKEVLHMNLEQLLNLRSALNALFSPGSSV